MSKRGTNPGAKAHHFKPGQSGNPEGARKHNPEIKKLKALTEVELIDVGTFIVKSKFHQLKELLKSPEISTLHAMAAGLAIKSVTKGDAAAFNALMDRLLGKVKEHVNLSGNIGGTSRVVLFLPKNGSEAPDEPKGE